METIDEKFDNKMKVELVKLLKRPLKEGELINADMDSNLVNEILWQLVKELDERVKLLESKK